MLVNDRNYSEDKKNKRLQYGSKQYKNLREYEKQDQLNLGKIILKRSKLKTDYFCGWARF